MTGLAAVQARVAELRALVEPARYPAALPATGTAAASTSASQFAAALADAAPGASGATAGAVATASTATATSPRLDESRSIAPGSGVTAQDLVAAAKKYQGVKYVWGGESLSEGGLDCSGLVLRSLTDLGVADGVPRVARDQQRLGTKVPSLDDALPGDLLVFNGGTHIAIYVGNGKMIDAPKPGGHVGVRDVWAEPTNIRRILPQEPVAAAPATHADASSASRAAFELLAGGAA
ncbi:C40 family peptidase [Cellulomonas massiliensis]|uniref:C40 family peptidase n=1 Tax=Cellulomonas massiliensis TaxID=1465811 RepID=UPI0003027F8B|nr:C40 family peptidase [Cellulomonas massiliensis]